MSPLQTIDACFHPIGITYDRATHRVWVACYTGLDPSLRRQPLMLKLLAVPLAVLSFHSVIAPVPPGVQARLTGKYWHAGCPVGFSQLRVLTVTTWGFDGKPHAGQLVVNQDAAAKLRIVFRKLYDLHFPIQDMRIDDAYQKDQPAYVSDAFECRQAVPSPCSGGSGTGHWSEHAYGEAVDINPVREPLRRLRHDAHRREQAVPRPVEAAARDGDACRRRGVRVGRLGLGRLLEREHEGLHALLGQRTLTGRLER